MHDSFLKNERVRFAVFPRRKSFDRSLLVDWSDIFFVLFFFFTTENWRRTETDVLRRLTGIYRRSRHDFTMQPSCSLFVAGAKLAAIKSFREFYELAQVKATCSGICHVRAIKCLHALKRVSQIVIAPCLPRYVIHRPSSESFPPSFLRGGDRRIRVSDEHHRGWIKSKKRFSRRGKLKTIKLVRLIVKIRYVSLRERVKGSRLRIQIIDYSPPSFAPRFTRCNCSW